MTFHIHSISNAQLSKSKTGQIFILVSYINSINSVKLLSEPESTRTV